MTAKSTPVDIKEEDIVSSVHDALQFISYYHPRDFIQHLSAAFAREESEAAKNAIAQILVSSRMAAIGHRPICQDTGLVIVFAKVGQNVRIVSAQGSEDELEREPVLLVPFNKYRSGTISFTQEFLEPGNFVCLVTVGNDRASVARFPFSVGAPRFSIWHYLGLGIVAVGAIFGFLLFGIKRRERILTGNRA
jgi:hypothetical protein